TYQFRSDHVTDLVRISEIESASINHEIEQDNEIAHANVRIRLTDNVDNDVFESMKTIIVDGLLRRSRGPIRHACDGDGGINPHPKDSLPDAPGGPYRDDRTDLRRLWHQCRFFVLVFLWNIYQVWFHANGRNEGTVTGLRQGVLRVRRLAGPTRSGLEGRRGGHQ